MQCLPPPATSSLGSVGCRRSDVAWETDRHPWIQGYHAPEARIRCVQGSQEIPELPWLLEETSHAARGELAAPVCAAGPDQGEQRARGPQPLRQPPDVTVGHLEVENRQREPRLAGRERDRLVVFRRARLAEDVAERAATKWASAATPPESASRTSWPHSCAGASASSRGLVEARALAMRSGSAPAAAAPDSEERPR